MILRLHHAQPADHRHGNPVLSAMYLVKRFIVPEYRRKIAMVDYSLEAARRATAAHLLAHCGNVVRHIPELARFGADWIRRRHLQRRRIPYVALRARNGRYPLDFNAEQTPNPDSRVTLSDERDAFGVPRLRVDWQLSAQDVDSIVENYAAFGRDVTASGIGRLDLDGRDLRGWAQQSAPVGGHHIGTTRMCDDPRHGVVDSNCCLHDVANVYVAGSSVFPTSGNANPTLTIVALAIRIADRLKLAHGLR